MTIHQLYLFDRHGQCLLHREWNKKRNKSKKDLENEKKLMFGLLFSAKLFVNQLSPRVLGSMENEACTSFRTKEYKVHFLETKTGLRWALTTDVRVPSMVDLLHELYCLFVDYITKNPLYEQGTPVLFLLFFFSFLAFLLTFFLAYFRACLHTCMLALRFFFVGLPLCLSLFLVSLSCMSLLLPLLLC